MRKMPLCFLFAVVLCSGWAANVTYSQNPGGAIHLTARITPTAARPEPVRQFTFYVLTRSYTEIFKEVDAQEATPTREKFIDDLKISPELKQWLKAHDVLDLTSTEIDRLFTPDDILHVPEFLLAYQRSNSGGVTHGIPKPKYTDADKTQNPSRYEKQYQEYLTELKKFIQAHPESVSGMELELTGVNPQTKWSQMQSDHQRRVLRLAPEIAQTKYLAAQTDTDLEGHASISNLPAGTYWISTLNLEAGAGDARLRWDVPVSIQGGRTTQIELTNLNATDAHAHSP
jgi:hypothetical protein